MITTKEIKMINAEEAKRRAEEVLRFVENDSLYEILDLIEDDILDQIALGHMSVTIHWLCSERDNIENITEELIKLGYTVDTLEHPMGGVVLDIKWGLITPLSRAL